LPPLPRSRQSTTAPLTPQRPTALTATASAASACRAVARSDTAPITMVSPRRSNGPSLRSRGARRAVSAGPALRPLGLFEVIGLVSL
jgi:hypothetical protein